MHHHLHHAEPRSDGQGQQALLDRLGQVAMASVTDSGITSWSVVAVPALV